VLVALAMHLYPVLVFLFYFWRSSFYLTIILLK
jgi:hypothetical protein